MFWNDKTYFDSVLRILSSEIALDYKTQPARASSPRVWCGHVCATYCGGAKGARPLSPEAEGTAGELGRGAQCAPGRLPGWQVGLQRPS